MIKRKSSYSPLRQNILTLRGNQTVKMEDLYLRMLQDDQYPGYSEYNFYGPQVYVQAKSQFQVLLNLFIHDINTFSVRPRLKNWKFGGDKFCREFWWSKTNFVGSVRRGPMTNMLSVIL